MKKLFLFALLLCGTTLFAQYKSATLHLKDGNTLKGLVKVMTLRDGIKFKKTTSDKATIYAPETINKFYLTEELTEEMKPREYVYKVSINSSFTVLLEVVISGKVSLYTRQMLKPDLRTGTGGITNFGTAGTVTQYYIGVRGSDYAEKVSEKSKLRYRQFKKIVSRSFNKCEKLTSIAKDKKKYKKHSVADIVKIYNKSCAR